jgi:hypothetical protein
VILIWFSSVYLGVHYVTDVVGGFAAGGAWLGAVITAWEAVRRRDTANRRDQVNSLRHRFVPRSDRWVHRTLFTHINYVTPYLPPKPLWWHHQPAKMLPGKEHRSETNVRFGILGTGVVGKTIAARLDAMGHGDAAAHVVAAVWCATEARLQLQDRPLIRDRLALGWKSGSL